MRWTAGPDGSYDGLAQAVLLVTRRTSPTTPSSTYSKRYWTATTCSAPG
ncbi:hypothetical protein WKI71_04850 [Streptomyces sp. MS1.AVA.1]|uniref:Uncharacterized protein n=1 Tax=Streptomyces machairae TaxID=3134109 RepID=A0ABU8UGV1_9ACTN